MRTAELAGMWVGGDSPGQLREEFPHMTPLKPSSLWAPTWDP